MAPKSPQRKRQSAAGSIVRQCSALSPKKVALVTKSCRSAVATLRGVDVPRRVMEALEKLSKDSIECDEIEATGNLLNMFRSVQHILDMQRQCAQAGVDNNNLEKAKRFYEQEAAQCRVIELDQIIAQTKAALVSDVAEIETLRRSLEKTYTAMKRSEIELSTVVGKKRKLEDVEKLTYEPLKGVAAHETERKKMLISLHKAGRDYGFHKELITVVPAILRKSPDKRRTFDGLVIRQLDAEFHKHAELYDTKVKGKAEVLVHQSAELEAVRAALRGADEERESNVLAITEAEKGLVAAKEKVVAARKHVLRFPNDLIQHYKSLTRAKACADTFRRGPLASIERALQRSARTLSVKAEVYDEQTEEEEEEEDEEGEETCVDEPGDSVPPTIPAPNAVMQHGVEKRCSMGRKYPESAD